MQSPSLWQPGFFPCDAHTCEVCAFGFKATSVSDGTVSFSILHRLSSSTAGVIYLIHCNGCNKKCVGETSHPLRSRISDHLYNIRSQQRTPVAEHFTASCSVKDFSFTGLEHYTNTTKRRAKETVWIRRLQTLSPQGLNSLTFTDSPLNHVLPHSQCSNQVLRVCRSILPDVKVRGSYRANRNLRSFLRGNR